MPSSEINDNNANAIMHSIQQLHTHIEAVRLQLAELRTTQNAIEKHLLRVLTHLPLRLSRKRPYDEIRDGDQDQLEAPKFSRKYKNPESTFLSSAREPASTTPVQRQDGDEVDQQPENSISPLPGSVWREFGVTARQEQDCEEMERLLEGIERFFDVADRDRSSLDPSRDFSGEADDDDDDDDIAGAASLSSETSGREDFDDNEESSSSSSARGQICKNASNAARTPHEKFPTQLPRRDNNDPDSSPDEDDYAGAIWTDPGLWAYLQRAFRDFDARKHELQFRSIEDDSLRRTLQYTVLEAIKAKNRWDWREVRLPLQAVEDANLAKGMGRGRAARGDVNLAEEEEGVERLFLRMAQAHQAQQRNSRAANGIRQSKQQPAPKSPPPPPPLTGSYDFPLCQSPLSYDNDSDRDKQGDAEVKLPPPSGRRYAGWGMPRLPSRPSQAWPTDQEADPEVQSARVIPGLRADTAEPGVIE